MKLTTGFSCSSLIRPQPKYFTKLFIRAVSRECWVIWNTNFGVNPVFVLSAFFVPFFFMFFPCFLRFIHFILHIKWIKRRKHERTHKKTNTKLRRVLHGSVFYMFFLCVFFLSACVFSMCFIHFILHIKWIKHIEKTHIKDTYKKHTSLNTIYKNACVFCTIFIYKIYFVCIFSFFLYIFSFFCFLFINKNKKKENIYKNKKNTKNCICVFCTIFIYCSKHSI